MLAGERSLDNRNLQTAKLIVSKRLAEDFQCDVVRSLPRQWILAEVCFLVVYGSQGFQLRGVPSGRRKWM